MRRVCILSVPGKDAVHIGILSSAVDWHWSFPWIFLFTFFRPYQAWLGVWVCRCRVWGG